MSPVIGVALMLVIVVALVAVSGTMFLGLSDRLVEPAPMVSQEQSIDVRVEGNDTDHRLQFVHQSGESVDADALRVAVRNGASTTTYDLDSGSAAALSDGSWSSGEKLRLELDESTVCAGDGETAQVELVYEGAGDSFLISDRRVPIERGQFLIDGDSVETTSEFTANVKFLGTGWSSPSYDFPVDVSVTVGGSTAHRWTSVLNSQTVVGSYGVSRQSAGTSVGVSARGLYSLNAYDASNAEPYFVYRPTGQRYHVTDGDWRTTGASTNDDYLTVLRDGDPVPNYEAADGQQAAAAYADPFINDSGYIDLADNQAVFLFDFNRNGPSNVDYQDAVVLVSFFAQQQDTAEVHNSGGQNVIVCPAETRNASPNGGNGNGN